MNEKSFFFPLKEIIFFKARRYLKFMLGVTWKHMYCIMFEFVSVKGSFSGYHDEHFKNVYKVYLLIFRNIDIILYCYKMNIEFDQSIWHMLTVTENSNSV